MAETTGLTRAYGAQMRRGLGSIDRAWRVGLGVFDCYTSSKRTFEDRALVSMENFTLMIVLELLHGVPETEALNEMMSQTLLSRMRPDGLFHFFIDRDALPADADCTATGIALLLRHNLISGRVADQALDVLLKNVDGDGVVTTYIDASSDRQDIVDPVVCVNVLYLAAMRDRVSEAAATLHFVEEVLRERLYSFGTRYYPRPENFLFFLTRLVMDFPDLFERLHGELRSAVLECRGASAYPLDRAQWLSSMTRLGLPVEAEMSSFMTLQRPDGTWPVDAFFRYGRSGVFFGTEMVTTAMAVSVTNSVLSRR
jgi:hypothetical protein